MASTKTILRPGKASLQGKMIKVKKEKNDSFLMILVSRSERHGNRNDRNETYPLFF